MAAETDQYIIVPTRRQADYILKQARREGLNVRNPISVDEAIHSDLRRTPYTRLHHSGGGVLVDEAVAILTALLHVQRIDAVSICARDCTQLETRFTPETLELMRALGQEVDE